MQSEMFVWKIVTDEWDQIPAVDKLLNSGQDNQDIAENFRVAVAIAIAVAGARAKQRYCGGNPGLPGGHG